MACRSTRQKIKDSVAKMSEDCDRILEHLKYACELAQGRSEPLKQASPAIITSVEFLQDFIDDVRSRL